MVSNLVFDNKKHVRWLRSIFPLDKKVFLLTTVSSSQKCSILSAAPLAFKAVLILLSDPELIFLGIDASSDLPREHSPVVSPAMPSDFVANYWVKS